jgi:hypothetical protein
MNYPVTFVQESRLILEEYMWNMERPIDPFHVASALYIDGSLNIAALEQALNLIIQRHGGLRAAFVPSGNLARSEREAIISNALSAPIVNSGLYAQRLAESASLQIHVNILETMDPEEQDIEIENILGRSIAAPFHYACPPFMRAHLFQLSAERHLLVLIVNHLVCDANGLIIMRRELEILYDSIVSQTPVPLPAVKRHFGDFAREQYQKAQNDDYDNAISYWRHQLIRFGSAQPKLGDMPPSFRNPVKPMDSGMGVRTLPLGVDILESWGKNANTHKISLFMLYLAGCMILFRKYGNANAVALWTNFSNNADPEYINAIGSYTNTHLLGVELSSHATVNDLLQSVRLCVLNAIANQSAPLSLVMAKPRPLSIPGASLQLVCDMIKTNQKLASEYRSKYISIKHAPLPEYMVGHWSQGLLLRLVHNGNKGSLFAVFPKRQMGGEGALNMLREIQSTITWCTINGERKIIEF